MMAALCGGCVHSKPACARQETHHHMMKDWRAHLAYPILNHFGDGTVKPGIGIQLEEILGRYKQI